MELKKRVNELFGGLETLKDDELKSAINTKMLELFAELKAENLDKMQDLQDAMSEINARLISQKESELFSLIAQADEMLKKIANKRTEIKQTLKASFEAAEELVNANDIERKDEILLLLNSAIMRETRMFGILNESVQSAFLTTIESGGDIKETAMQIAKNISYNAINEGELSSGRIIEIAKAIVSGAIEVANESKIFAKELVCGAIEGTREGILRTLENLKSNAKFTPTEAGLAKIVRDLRDIEDKFIQMIKDVGAQTNDPSRSAIEHLLDESLDSNVAKLRRISEQAAEELVQKLEDIKENATVNEFLSSTSEKFEKLKNELNERTKNINLDEKIEGFEKKASEKLDEMKQLDIKQEAKKIGDRAYSVARDFLNKIRKNDQNNKDNKNA
ncbi:hypothetical protein [Campylobacter suis]|uniref:Cell surface protein n=1 Tax=Campylobacter suis TaxID=2790657 RepID=A0ABM8Q545_9BACT|nr:hypothetical protein [Campylobacter suis]CAD7288013.1 hypothetical protein LMG8286_01091 [Campylobacter suis]